MSIINRVANQRTDRSKGYYFRVFRIAARPRNHRPVGARTGTTSKSSVIFPLQSRKNTGKTGVADKKSQKTPRKTV
jgi:hypothetical protein